MDFPRGMHITCAQTGNDGDEVFLVGDMCERELGIDVVGEGFVANLCG